MSSVRHPLPYAFARSARLLLEDDGARRVLWHDGRPDPSALSEVLRRYGGADGADQATPPLTLQTLDAQTLAQRIGSAYEQLESSAAAVVSEVESEADLSRIMQELPAVEDLLESADDAPIIRMLNALLTQAAREGA
ncbi:MAG: type II secretion system protein GspE, partial [Burkholderiaceae bacterium]|nr:type II secretion system protein GspE [Burkholderiaceae bacterium]